MQKSRVTTGRRAAALALGVAASTLMLIGGGQSASGNHLTVTEVEGSAFGCYASVSLFGGPPGVRGPLPTAELPPGGGADVETAPECHVQYGPAIIFTSGPILLNTEGTTGPTGAATSTAIVGPVNTSGQEVFTAANLASSCTASESGNTGSTTILGGLLQVSEGDPDVEGDEVLVPIPTNPAPNTAYNGTIEAVGDNFRAVFNEQIVNPDGSLTVNAYHLYLLGPIAVGDVIAGSVTCGVTTEVAPTTTTEATTTTVVTPTTSTTVVTPTTSTTVVAPTTTTTSAPGNMPTDKEQCKNGGYAAFGFRNQGQCVSFVNQQNRG